MTSTSGSMSTDRDWLSTGQSCGNGPRCCCSTGVPDSTIPCSSPTTGFLPTWPRWSTWTIGDTAAATRAILQSTMGRLEIGRIVEDFRRAGGDEAAEAARGYWSLGDDLDAMAAYATTCLPLYGSGSSDPNRLSRGELNFELLMDPIRVLHDMDLLPGLAAVRCPTLVIAGEQDPLCGVTPMQEVVDALPTNLVRFEQLPNSGHYVSRNESERFFTLVRDFVAAEQPGS